MIATSPTKKPAPAGFPRFARVRAKAEFDRVFGKGRRIADPLMSLHVLGDAQDARLGLAVSRKVDPHAVGRNRIKRVLRDAFRRARPRIAAGAYVLVARTPARHADNAELRAAFVRVLERAGALPLTPPVGTMPAAMRSRPRDSSFPPDSAAHARRPSLPAR